MSILFKLTKNLLHESITRSVNLEFNLNKSYMSKNKKSSKKGLENEKGAASNNSAGDHNNAVFINKSGEICLNIFAKPGSKETGITDVQPDVINVKVAAPPVDGEANKELIRYITKLTKLKNSDVNLDKGSKNRNKVIILSNCTLSVDDLLTLLKNESDGD